MAEGQEITPQQEAQIALYEGAKALVQAYYTERELQISEHGSRGFKHYALGKHDNEIRAILDKDPAYLSSGERKTLLRAAEKADEEKGLKHASSPVFDRARATFEQTSSAYLDTIGESSDHPVHDALKAAKPENGFISGLKGFGGVIGGAAKSAAGYMSERGIGGAAYDAGANIVGFGKYVATNPHEALTLTAQGAVNGVASTVALVPALVKVVYNNPIRWLANTGLRVFDAPPIPKWPTDFNKMFTVVSNDPIVGNAIRGALLVGTPTGWAKGFEILTTNDPKKRAQMFSESVFSSKGIVEQIKLHQDGKLEGAQSVILFGSQAVAEVGAFVAVSVPTFGLGGVALGATRTAIAGEKITAAVVRQSWDGGNRFGWKIMRPYTSREQRVTEAAELAATRTAAGQLAATQFAQAAEKAESAASPLEKASAAWGQFYHRARAVRLLGEESGLGVRSSRLPAWINNLTPSWFPKVQAEKLGIAAESAATQARFAADAAAYTATFSKAAADDSVRGLFWRSTTMERLPNFGIVDNFRRTALQNPGAFTTVFNPLRVVVRQGGAVAGWAGGLEVAGAVLSFTMNSAANAAETARMDQKRQEFDQADQDANAAAFGLAPEGHSETAASPEGEEHSALTPEFGNSAVIPASAAVSGFNELFYTVAKEVARRQKDLRKQGVEIRTDVLLADADHAPAPDAPTRA